MSLTLKLLPKMWLLTLCALTSACCTQVRRYDLSTTPPFVSYAGKEVTLARDALLVAYRGNGPSLEPLPITDNATRFAIQYSAHHDDNSAAQALEEDKYVAVMPLHAGTRVRVLDAQLWSSNQGFSQGFFHLEELQSTVAIKLDAPGWPSEVKAVFAYGDPPPYVHFEGKEAKIRSAPWEPETSSTKRIGWPDDKYLVPSDKGR